MSIFKKFTDGCCGLTLLCAGFYLFFQFMAYSSLMGDLSKIEVLKKFFSVANHRDFRPYLCLMGLLMISLAVSVFLRKYPSLCLVISAFPLAYAMVMLDSDWLYERPMLYVTLCAVHWVGNLWECVRLDRLDGRQRTAWGTAWMAIAISAVALYLYICCRMPTEMFGSRINFLEQPLLDRLSKEEGVAVCLRPVWLYAVAALLSVLLRDLHMIRAAISVIPLIDLWLLFGAERLSIYGAALVSVATLYTVSCVVMMLSCPPRLEKRM